MGTAWGPSLRDYCPSSSQGPVLSPQVPVLAKADLNPDSLSPFRSPCCPSQYSPLVRPKATDSIQKTLRKIPRVMVLGDRRRRDVTRSANCDSCGDQGLLLPGGNHQEVFFLWGGGREATSQLLRLVSGRGLQGKSRFTSPWKPSLGVRGGELCLEESQRGPRLCVQRGSGREGCRPTELQRKNVSLIARLLSSVICPSPCPPFPSAPPSQSQAASNINRSRPHFLPFRVPPGRLQESRLFRLKSG